MTKYSVLFRTAALLILLVPALFLCSCAQDRPPDDGTPAPPPLDGSFSCSLGTLTFSGDGKSVTAEMTAEGSGLLGLPQGKSSGSYVFLFRNEQWRYDKAETFRIILETGTYSFRSLPGQTGESAVAIYPDTEGSDPVVFRKKG